LKSPTWIRVVMLGGATAAASAAVLAKSPLQSPAPSEHAPAYTADGLLLVPADYREWIFLSAGLDMNYSEKADISGMSMFGNVFVNPEAYRAFRETGTWPDNTQLVLENRNASSKGSINKHGKYQTVETMGVEVHVKDTARFDGGWAFFASDDGIAPAQKFPATASCYACHRDHAAVDTTFVQFYPTLLPLAVKKATLSERYVRDEASPPVAHP